MLKDLLRTDFNNARKSGDIDKRTAIEAVLAAILLKEKSQKGKTLTDEEVMDCITKELKVQREIFEMYADRNTQKAEQTAKKIKILKSYLPKQLSDEEVLSIIKELDVYPDASGKTKGMIIKNLMPKIKGRYDNAKASKMVDEYLSNK